jgi:hypothetical protein
LRAVGSAWRREIDQKDGAMAKADTLLAVPANHRSTGLPGDRGAIGIANG